MDVEEIVALSVKHNVSDLHLCSDSPPRWRRSGRLEPAPFPPPEVDTLLKRGSTMNSRERGGRTGRWILPSPWRATSACAEARLNRQAASQ